MLRAMLEARSLVAMIVATAVGVGGLHAYPFPREHVFLESIAPLMTSVLAMLASQNLPPMRPRPLQRYPVPEQQPTPTVVLGEAHFASVPGQASEPAWLTIPQCGLYTGVIILGAVGTGKTSTYQGALRQRPWTLWTPHDVTHLVHPYDAELDAHLTGQKIPFDVRTGDAAICADRRHWLEAIDRWFTNTWRKLHSNVKASIVEGLNFPVALNPALARGLRVMLKLDFQRAVLQRIPKIAAQRDRAWRDLLLDPASPR
jgi:hypothetical protein